MPLAPRASGFRRRFVLAALALASGFFTACGGGSSHGGTPNPPPPEPTPPPSTPPPPVATPAPDPAPPPDTSLAGRLDAVLANHRNRSGGAAVIVMKDGEVAYRAAIGLAVAASATPVTPNTGFRIASISKSFTALAVMQLVEEGTVTLNQPIRDFLPELPPAWEPITIEMLLSHRSGIIDVVSDILPSTWLQGYTNADIITYLARNPDLEFSPGAMGEYSNTGYILLAEIIARATGQTFNAYMAANIFAPAGMADTYINDEHQPLLPDDALGYGNRSTFFGTTTHIKGGMAQVSSVEDFGSFFRALRTHTLVSADTLALMRRNPHNTILFGQGYGYGFMLEGDRFGHAGSWDGYRTKMSLDPATGIDLAVLCSGGSAMQDLINKVYSTVYDFYRDPLPTRAITASSEHAATPPVGTVRLRH